MTSWRRTRTIVLIVFTWMRSWQLLAIERSRRFMTQSWRYLCKVDHTHLPPKLVSISATEMCVIKLLLKFLKPYRPQSSTACSVACIAYALQSRNLLLFFVSYFPPHRAPPGDMFDVVEAVRCPIMESTWCNHVTYLLYEHTSSYFYCMTTLLEGCSKKQYNSITFSGGSLMQIVLCAVHIL